MSVIIKRIWNQNKMVNIESLHGMAFQAEDGGHVFEISGVNDAGEAVPLSGTVAGVFMRADRADIALTGAASGGVASVTLTDDCYAVPGRFGLTIFVTEDGEKTAVYAAVGTVSVTSGGGVAGDTPQSVVDLINAIEEAVATIPASYSGLMADIAPTYSSSAVYPVGAYVYYNGDLYCCTTAITTPESWTAAHWTAAVLTDDIEKIDKFGEETRYISDNNNTRTDSTVASVFGAVDSIGDTSYKFFDPVGSTEITMMSLNVAGGQTGSGVSAPDNVRAFSFPSAVGVSLSNEQGTSISKTVDLSKISSIVHKGMLHPLKGCFIAEEKKITLNGDNIKVTSIASGRNIFFLDYSFDLPNDRYTGNNYTLLCDKLQNIPTNATWNNYSQFISVNYSNTVGAFLAIKPGVTIDSIEAATNWLKANTPTVVYTASKKESFPVPLISLSTYYGLNTLSITNGSINTIQAFDRKLNEYASQLKSNNIFDYLASKELAPLIGKTFSNNGIDYTTTNKQTILVDGTATADSYCNLTRKKVQKGKTFRVKLNGGSISLKAYINDVSNNTIQSFIFSHDGFFTVPNLSTVDNLLIRLSVPNGTEIDNAEVDYSVESVPNTEELKILVFGNSFSYSTLSYVPSLIEEIIPQLNVTFGILYSSGMDFAGHITKWNNDGAYSTYNEYRTKDQKWNKFTDEITARNALDRVRWDCIILQQSVEHLDDFDNLEVFADLLNGYLSFPVKYLYNMGQARGADGDTWLPSHYTGSTMGERSNKHFADIADYAERALAGCIISEVVPSATAVQNARTTSLSQYGESGNLCKDNLSHLQNGIGILTAGYAAAYKILEVTGQYGKIYGAQLSPTDTWVTGTNVPSTMHGSCVGISTANMLLGMKCAMMAIKNPFEITDCSNI